MKKRKMSVDAGHELANALYCLIQLGKRNKVMNNNESKTLAVFCTYFQIVLILNANTA